VKIVLETNFDFGGEIEDGEVELKSDHATIRTLLEELARWYSGEVTFINPETDEIDPDEYMVLVNGGEWEFLPERLETKLEEGDRVSITKWVEILGGG